MTNETSTEPKSYKYGGFWIRVLASLIDSVLLALLIIPILTAVYGKDYWMGNISGGIIGILVNYILPAIVVLIFWFYKSATPGKMVLNLKIVDAKTGGKPSTGQFIGRYFGYYLSMLPLFLGLVWVAFQKQKRGFHDLVAGTMVIYEDKS